MNKELLMQFLSESIDKGAILHLHMPQYDITSSPVEKDEALRFAAMLKDAVGGEITEAPHELCDSFIVEVDKFRACFSHSPVEKAEV